jgi:hypothetical protein
MNTEVAGVEGADQLLQGVLFGGTLGAFEQDDRTSSMRNLRQLPFGDAIAKRPEHQFGIIATRAGETGFSVDHGVGSYRNLRRAQRGVVRAT